MLRLTAMVLFLFVSLHSHRNSAAYTRGLLRSFAIRKNGSLNRLYNQWIEHPSPSKYQCLTLNELNEKNK